LNQDIGQFHAGVEIGWIQLDQLIKNVHGPARQIILVIELRHSSQFGLGLAMMSLLEIQFHQFFFGLHVQRIDSVYFFVQGDGFGIKATFVIGLRNPLKIRNGTFLISRF